MQKVILIIVPVLLAILVMGGLYYTGPEPAEQAISFSAAETHAEKKKRVYSKRLIEKNRYQYPDASVKEWAFHSGRLYLLDGQSQEILIVDSMGVVQNRLGKQGDAPWENRQTQHLWVDTEGYATIDNAHMVVKKYDHSDQLLFYSKMHEPIWDGVYMGGKEFFLLDDEPTDPGFYTINAGTGTEGERISLTSMIEEVPDSEYLNVVFEGQVLRNDRNILYLCARTGSFFVFSGDGKYMYTGHTLDKTPPPSVKTRRSGKVTYYVREPDVNVNYSGTMDKDYLYVLSLISWKQTSELSVDAYELKTGQYVFSFVVPNAGNDLPIEILFGGNNLFVLYEGLQIICYELADN